MSQHPRAAVLQTLLDRALDLMAETYREARARQEDPKRIERMVATGRELRKWQQAAQHDTLPPPDAASLPEIAKGVRTYADDTSDLYEAVLDASRFQKTFGKEAAR